MGMKATMTAERQGEIALIYLRAKLRREGITIKSRADMHRAMANEAKNIGISFDEAIEFAEIFAREIVEETFAKTTSK